MESLWFKYTTKYIICLKEWWRCTMIWSHIILPLDNSIKVLFSNIPFIKYKVIFSQLSILSYLVTTNRLNWIQLQIKCMACFYSSTSHPFQSNLNCSNQLIYTSSHGPPIMLTTTSLTILSSCIWNPDDGWINR